MTPPNSAEPQPLELEIYSLPFRLRAPVEEHDRLRRAAEYVNSVMRDLVSAQPAADTTRLAIQAAFLITKDYFKAMDEGLAKGVEPVRVTRRVDQIISQVEGALSEIDTVLVDPDAQPAAEAEPATAARRAPAEETNGPRINPPSPTSQA